MTCGLLAENKIISTIKNKSEQTKIKLSYYYFERDKLKTNNTVLYTAFG